MWAIVVLVLVLLAGIGVAAWFNFYQKGRMGGQKATVVAPLPFYKLVQEEYVHVHMHVQDYVVPQEVVSLDKSGVEDRFRDKMAVQKNNAKGWVTSEVTGSTIKGMDLLSEKVVGLQDRVDAVRIEQEDIIMANSNLFIFADGSDALAKDYQELELALARARADVNGFPLDTGARLSSVNKALDAHRRDFVEFGAKTDRSLGGLASTIPDVSNRFGIFTAKVTSDLGLYNTAMNAKLDAFDGYMKGGFSNVDGYFRGFDATLASQQGVLDAVRQESTGYGSGVLGVSGSYTDQNQRVATNALTAIHSGLVNAVTTSMQSENLVLRGYSDKQLSAAQVYTGAQVESMSNVMAQYLNNKITYVRNVEDNDASALTTLILNTQSNIYDYIDAMNKNVVRLQKAVSDSNIASMNWVHAYTDSQTIPQQQFFDASYQKLADHDMYIAKNRQTSDTNVATQSGNYSATNSRLSDMDSTYTNSYNANSYVIGGHSGQIQSVQPLPIPMNANQVKFDDQSGSIGGVQGVSSGHGTSITDMVNTVKAVTDMIPGLKQSVEDSKNNLVTTRDPTPA